MPHFIVSVKFEDSLNVCATVVQTRAHGPDSASNKVERLIEGVGLGRVTVIRSTRISNDSGLHMIGQTARLMVIGRSLNSPSATMNLSWCYLISDGRLKKTSDLSENEAEYVRARTWDL